MLQFVVTKDVEGSAGLVNIRVADVIYLQTVSDSHVAIHTKDAMFYSLGSVKYFAKTLEASGKNFFISDKGVLINVDNIRRLDKAYNYAYFDSDINDQSKSCSISRRATKGLMDLITSLGMVIEGV